MRKKVILWGLAIIFSFFICADYSLAEDNNFADTEQEIIQKLLKPKAKTRGLTRSFVSGQGAKTRTIVVMSEKNNQPVQKTIVVSDNDLSSKVNMKIEFNHNSSAIRSDAFYVLNELGKAVTSTELQTKNLTIIGHTDSDGSGNYNLNLSLNRANSVKNFLVKSYNIHPDRIAVFGYGETIPLVDNTTSDNKQVNRRVEIRAE